MVFFFVYMLNLIPNFFHFLNGKIKFDFEKLNINLMVGHFFDIVNMI